jgi:hypothetical protein
VRTFSFQTSINTQTHSIHSIWLNNTQLTLLFSFLLEKWDNIFDEYDMLYYVWLNWICLFVCLCFWNG